MAKKRRRKNRDIISTLMMLIGTLMLLGSTVFLLTSYFRYQTEIMNQKNLGAAVMDVIPSVRTEGVFRADERHLNASVEVNGVSVIGVLQVKDEAYAVSLEHSSGTPWNSDLVAAEMYCHLYPGQEVTLLCVDGTVYRYTVKEGLQGNCDFRLYTKSWLKGSEVKLDGR